MKRSSKPRKAVQLYAFVGLNDNQQPSLFVSPCKLNQVGKRNEKGTPFPEAVYDWADEPSLNSVMPALCALQRYFDKLADK